MEVGHFEESLQRHLWYHNHALEYDQGQAGVRLSFDLSDWIELGRQYPKAKQALIEIRDREAQKIIKGEGTFSLFMDLSSINGYLHESDATVSVFENVELRDQPLAKQRFGLVESLLTDRGQYDKCLNYVGDPQAAFERFCESRNHSKAYAETSAARRVEQTKRFQEMGKTNPTYANLPPPFMPALPPSYADGNFIGQVRQLIEILVATRQETDAKKIQEQAVSVLHDARLESALSDCLESSGGLPSLP